MTIGTYAIVESGVVTNIILWDGGSGWAPPVGSTAQLLPAGLSISIGYLFDGTQFAPPLASS